MSEHPSPPPASRPPGLEEGGAAGGVAHGSGRATDGRTSVDRADGALVGTALGDAVGAPFEGRTEVATTDVDRHLEDTHELRWTDDTAMTLALAGSLAATGGEVDADHLGRCFAATYAAEPWRGYGAGPPQVFAEAAAGHGYREAAAQLFDGSGSLGNGGAMRCAPAAIVGAPDPERTAALAAAQAEVTHAHPEGLDGAVLLAAVVAHVLHLPADHDLDLGAVPLPVEALRSEGLRDAWTRLRALSTDRRAAGELAAAQVPDVRAATSVPAAVAVALAHDGDPVGVLRAAVSLGGDTDTVAAMAGAVAGARAGAGGWPRHLLRRLEGRERLHAAAVALTGR